MQLEGILLAKFQMFVDNLNIGCDRATDVFMEKTYLKLGLASAMYVTLDRDRLLSCTLYFSVLLIHSILILLAGALLTISAIELYKISFALFVHEIHLMCLVMLSFLALWQCWHRRQNVARLHRIISQKFFDYEEDLSETMTILETAMLKERRRYMYLVVLIGFACGVSILIASPINMSLGTFDYSTTRGTINFDLPVPAADPFNPHDVRVFYSVYAYEVLAASIVALITSTNSFMVIYSILNIQMHVKLLAIQFKNLEARAAKLCGVRPGRKISRDKRFIKCIKICLKKNIQHHHIIIKAVDEENNTYSFSIAFFYLIAAVDIAISVLSTSSMNEFPGTTVSSIVLCLIEVCFVALFAHLGQKLTDLSYLLREEIYNVPWYYYDESVARTITILLLGTLKPLSFTFFNLLHINYDSFSKVMNSAYSYYSIVNAYM